MARNVGGVWLTVAVAARRRAMMGPTNMIQLCRASSVIGCHSLRTFTVPACQRAVIVDAGKCPSRGPDALVLAKGQPVPVCGEGEVLIQVAFAGVNRPDIMQRRGLYPPPRGHSPTLGLEVSGIVLEVGKGVSSVRIGQEVCALTPGGGYGEYALAPEGSVLPVPTGMCLRDAAALPETFFTVYYNVFMKGQLEPGQTLLVHGGVGGIKLQVRGDSVFPRVYVAHWG